MEVKMSAGLFSSLSSLFIQFCLPPFTVLLVLVLFLASFGRSLGIGRLYVRVLLRIFEFARTLALNASKDKRKVSFSVAENPVPAGEESEDEEEENQKPLDDKTNSSVNESNPGLKEEVKEEELKENAENGELSENEEVENNGDDLNSRRNYMKHFGKESRHNVISRKDNLILHPHAPPMIEEETKPVSRKVYQKKLYVGEAVSAATFQREFEMDDILDYIKTGIASVIEDEVTQRFVAEELKSWNLLTRTAQSFEFVNFRLSALWVFGFVIRYFVLLPGRTIILVVGLMWMAVCMVFVGQLPEGNFKRWLHFQVYTSCFQLLGGSLSAVITYHNAENKPKDGICVANHTSPIDVLILASDNAYALIGQRHHGLLGKFQNILSKSADHIWFERSESKDRALITSRLKDHVEDPNKLPILIFPEGTCINNTSVMQFKKGSFEVGGTIYPVAIKYDPKFGDAFWNSSEYGMLHYLYMMMTSWAIVCDVWYLPPMTRGVKEDAVDFANRVKGEIARKGGLVDLMWDGNLKRTGVKSEWKAKQQEEFSRRLKVE